MLYKLINPSDPYTFRAKDRETAALTVFLLGTMYGAMSKEGEENIPVFLFGGATEWYKETFGRNHHEGLEERGNEVADALQSFVYGEFEERELYERALAAMTDAKAKEVFIRRWQDRRTSMNDIRGRAWKIAEVLKRTEEKHERDCGR